MGWKSLGIGLPPGYQGARRFYAEAVTGVRGSTRAATLLTLIALVAAFVATARGSTPGLRSWSIAAAGYPRVVIHPGKGTMSKRTVAITLPKGAVQGGRTWYLIHLHYRLVLDPQTPPGDVYVEAATDGYPCAMIRFDVTRVNGKPRVKAAASGLISNGVKAVGLVHEDTFENYLEYRGVRGGRNTVTFTAERLGPARFLRLTIFGDTRVVLTRASLPALAVEPFAPRRVTAGVPFALAYRIRNTGGSRTLAGQVGLVPGSGLRQLRGGAFPALRPGGVANGSLRLLAPHRGTYRLTIVAQGGNAGNAATLALTAQ